MPRNSRKSKKVEEPVDESSSSSESENEEEEQQNESGSDSGSESSGSEESNSEESDSESEQEEEEEVPAKKRQGSYESESCANSTSALKSMALQHAMSKSSPSSTLAKNNTASVSQAKASIPHPQSLILPSAAPASLTLQQPSAAPASLTLQQPLAAPVTLQQPSAAPATLTVAPVPQQPSAAPAKLQQPSAAPSRPELPKSPATISSPSSAHGDYGERMKANILQSASENGTRTVSENKALLNSLRHHVDCGVITFPDVQVSFIGSYHSLDRGKNIKTLKEVVGTVLNNPKVRNHELAAAIKKHYEGMKHGMIYKVEVKGFSNPTDKDILLRSNNSELNGHIAIVKNGVTHEGIIILQAGETVTLDRPICVVDHCNALENESRHEGLVLKKLPFRVMRSEQVVVDDSDAPDEVRILIPSELLPKERKANVGQHLRKELSNPDKAATFKHTSLAAYIIVTGINQGRWLGEDKINLDDLDVVEVKRGGKKYLRLPKSIVDEAEALYGEVEEKEQQVASVRLDDVELKIEPVHTLSFSDIEDTKFQWDFEYSDNLGNAEALFGTEDTDAITGKLNDLSKGVKANLIREIGITKKVTAILNISVIPSLAGAHHDHSVSPSGASAKVL